MQSHLSAALDGLLQAKKAAGKPAVALAQEVAKEQTDRARRDRSTRHLPPESERAKRLEKKLSAWRRGKQVPATWHELSLVLDVLVRDKGKAAGHSQPTDTRPQWQQWQQWWKEARDGTLIEPRPGRLDMPVTRWDPVALGVHRAIGGGPAPAYVARPHDGVLRAAMEPAGSGGRLIVLRGESSTGKSRTAYEAVLQVLPSWRLEYPRTVETLEALLEAGIPPRTVVWLNELRDYAEAPGGQQALGRLADRLTGLSQVVVLTSVWPEFWAAYAGPRPWGPGQPDLVAGTRMLLSPLPCLSLPPSASEVARSGVIDVPPVFSETELRCVMDQDDRVLAVAAAAARRAGEPGRIAQYLAGVPDLLEHYRGVGADPYGTAVITAAIDATRLGHTNALPVDLLTDAAVGYLDPTHRATAPPDWARDAIAYATRLLKGAIRALEPVPPARGVGIAGYRLTDYLDQDGRHRRREVLGPASLWDALARHTTHPDDLTRLAKAAEDRLLYRHAATFAYAGTRRGDTAAAALLLGTIWGLNHAPSIQAAITYTTTHADLTDPQGTGDLLALLKGLEAQEAVSTLLGRDPAVLADPTDPWAVAMLLPRLRDVGAKHAVTVLAGRAAAHADVTSPKDVAVLLRELREAREDEAVTVLAGRAAAHAQPTDPRDVVDLLSKLQEASQHDAVMILAGRAAAHADLTDPTDTGGLLHELREMGADDAVTVLLGRNPAAQVDVSNPTFVGNLLYRLQEAGADEAVALLTDRAARADPTGPWAAARLVAELQNMEIQQATNRLVECAAAGGVTYTWGVAALLYLAREMGAFDAVTVLLRRNPGAQADPTDPRAVAGLLACLHEVGADQDVATLASRAAADADLTAPAGVIDLLDAMQKTGADTDTATTLASRAANSTHLTDPLNIAFLLRKLHGAQMSEATVALADRAAAEASMVNTVAVERLLHALREVGAGQSADTLADRAADVGVLPHWVEHSRWCERTIKLADTTVPGHRVGRAPEGTEPAPWTWEDITNSGVE